jgi:hypothetical protein
MRIFRVKIAVELFDALLDIENWRQAAKASQVRIRFWAPLYRWLLMD